MGANSGCRANPSKCNCNQLLDQRTAAHGEHDELLAPGHVGDRGAGRIGWQRDLRKHLAVGLVVHPQMWIEIGEVVDAPAGSLCDPWFAVVAHLHDDHHGLGYQRPAASREPHLPLDAKLPDGGKKLAMSDRDAPAMIAGVHVDSDDASIWRLEQGHSGRAPEIAE